MNMHPIIEGIRTMVNGVISASWFGIAGFFAWKVTSSVGWIAALYFVGFVAFAAYGIMYLHILGAKTIKNCRQCAAKICRDVRKECNYENRV